MNHRCLPFFSNQPCLKGMIWKKKTTELNMIDDNLLLFIVPLDPALRDDEHESSLWAIQWSRSGLSKRVCILSFCWWKNLDEGGKGGREIWRWETTKSKKTINKEGGMKMTQLDSTQESRWNININIITPYCCSIIRTKYNELSFCCSLRRYSISLLWISTLQKKLFPLFHQTFKSRLPFILPYADLR